VDQFRDRTLRRPDVNTTAPTLRINLHIQGTRCDLSLDASDDSLHRRGYRRDTVEAPLNEVLAAGMILLSGWSGQTHFADPMCGSGTLPVEAAMIALGLPPQHKRPVFGFQRWPHYDPSLWESVKKEADSRTRTALDIQIMAADKDPRARNAASLNALSCGVEQWIKIDKTAFEKNSPPADHGTLITNPPYDERLQVADVQDFYRSIGDGLKQQWAGWEAWLISSNRDALKHVGLRSSRRITLFNGALECSFQRFDLYEGSQESNSQAERIPTAATPD
ncbi:MAG TPA: class I SAM-dependent RNA methyltransferase, partial [Saprospiraceae bacterium]|nr:class I SAM-dependent RNA methyltransferase [Saprospiraceae bacterium]